MGIAHAQIPHRGPRRDAALDFGPAGSVTVTVVSPLGRGTSAGVTFTIQNVEPTTSGLTPWSTVVGGSAFVLTVAGTGFVSRATVKWNGTARTTAWTHPQRSRRRPAGVPLLE
jgi:hypothetical protein